MGEPPTLPATMSPDGREVWAWGDALSRYTQWLHRKRQIRHDIVENERRCGSCDKWMKSRECPRERNVNGMTRGPSCAALPCGGFVLSASSAKFLADRRTLLAQLERQGPHPAESNAGVCQGSEANTAQGNQATDEVFVPLPTIKGE